MRRIDPLIIGGGPAGSAAAIRLASTGAKPLIIEKSRETGDALCGGFLSWRTLQTLASLGIAPDSLGGHRVDRLRLFAGRRQAEAPLPGGAIGVSRRRLDTVMLDAARSAGTGIERGIAVKRRVGDTLTLGDGGRLASDSIFLATGKQDLPGMSRPRTADSALGLRLHLPAHPGLTRLLEGAIELHLFNGGYAGLVLQESGHANLCLAVRKSRLGGAGGDPALLMRQIADDIPALGERLAFAGGRDIDAIGAVPYGWIARATGPGLFRLGDQAGVIPSLAGEGNGIAIASGMRAARAWLDGGGGASPAYQAGLATALRRPIGVAKAIWALCEQPLGARVSVAAMAALPALGGTLARLTRIGVDEHQR